jgi:membrane-anchored glycerophosphoryl diester phosphodiesterase (GDPDase)
LRQQVIGITLLIFGFYLVLINPIVSFLVHVVFNVRISVPYFNLWIDALRELWWWIALLFAGLGFVLIKYGRRYMLNSNSVSLKSAEAQ